MCVYVRTRVCVCACLKCWDKPKSTFVLFSATLTTNVSSLMWLFFFIFSVYKIFHFREIWIFITFNVFCRRHLPNMVRFFTKIEVLLIKDFRHFFLTATDKSTKVSFDAVWQEKLKIVLWDLGWLRGGRSGVQIQAKRSFLIFEKHNFPKAYLSTFIRFWWRGELSWVCGCEIWIFV